MSFPSRHFYGNRLRAHSSVARHLLFDDDKPLAFIDTAGCGYEERREDAGISNPEEAAFLLRHANGLVAALEARYAPPNFPPMAIISPYRQQVQQLRELLPHYPALLRNSSYITVNTIDSFQGQERDIVYIGMTRSNPDSQIGFLSDNPQDERGHDPRPEETRGDRRQQHPCANSILCRVYHTRRAAGGISERLGIYLLKSNGTTILKLMFLPILKTPTRSVV